MLVAPATRWRTRNSCCLQPTRLLPVTSLNEGGGKADRYDPETGKQTKKKQTNKNKAKQPHPRTNQETPTVSCEARQANRGAATGGRATRRRGRRCHRSHRRCHRRWRGHTGRASRGGCCRRSIAGNAPRRAERTLLNALEQRLEFVHMDTHLGHKRLRERANRARRFFAHRVSERG